MSNETQIIFCACPHRESAESLARLLVESNLAACVNIIPGMTSIYRWREQIESAQEHLLFIKSNKANYQAVESALVENHPYELPEIIAVSIEQGLPGYLHWIDSCLTAN